ncbi:MAG: hypothetical protein WA980_14935 [Shinella zoogloeoides]|uniref:glutamine synthetase family protein n=1 Tax=Shinella zoogloeoides TaxID=352475 RepID=UPI003C7915FA
MGQPEASRAAAIAAARGEIGKRGLKQVTVAHFDTNATLRGKLISADSFLAALEGGTGLPAVFTAVDYKEAVVPGLPITDAGSGYRNSSVQIDPLSMRVFPHGARKDDLLFLLQFDDDSRQYCPRAILTKALEDFRGLGLDIYSAFEYEFSVLDETPATALTKSADALVPFEDNPVFGSIVQQVCNGEFYHELSEVADTMGFPLDALHKELGAGLLEVALKPSVGLRSADNAALFKTMAKAVAKRRGLTATFMAKLKMSLQGHGGHVHLSFRDIGTGKAAFADPDGQFGMSARARHFVAGLQRYLPELALMALPNINSYRRLIPNAWAPVYPNWGFENRTCALRVVGTSPASKRVEIRLAGADANPYLALAAFITAGRLGIEQALEPSEPCAQNGWDEASVRDLRRFPSSLPEATETFAASEVARAQFGETFLIHYAGIKRAQSEDFARTITDWEIRNLLISS